MKLKIQGLDCANCAMKIEDELKKDSRLEEVNVDFVNQCISYSTKKDVKVDEIKKVITKIEPDVTFLDEKIEKYIYHIGGLDCAECASSFEKKINEQEEVKKAVVDFTNQKLIIEYNEKDFNKIKEIASQFDDGLTLSKTKEDESDGINWEIIISVSIALILVASTFIIDMSKTVELIVLFVAYIVAGYDVLLKLVKNLLKGQLFDENFLMGIATVAAFGIGEYTEAIAVMVFYKVGEFFQDMAVNKSRKSITGLMDIQAEYANLVVDNDVKQVNPEDVKIGDKVLIKPGEKIPLDGVVVEGTTFIDTKALTGESADVKVKIGSEVLSGSINKESVITIEVTKEYSDSTVAKILDLVENSSASKAPTENFITKFARVYTPTVVFIALAVAIVPPLTFSAEGFYPWIYRALIFLVISCPCALVISIPLGFFGGVGNASKHGILVKGANYLEALSKLDTVVFDKTGTLTKGNFTVVALEPESSYNKEELLKVAAYAESYSTHPIAISIIESYGKKVDFQAISDYEEISGQGIRVKINNEEVLAGNYLLMENNKISATKKENVGTIVYLAKAGKYLGYIEVADEIKEDTKQGLENLKALGVNNLVMLTGDNEQVAKKVASEVGITKYFSKLLPNQKVEKLEELDRNKEAGSKIAFVGDGINDAPVLTRADIGIAMGGVGSDAAIESADIVIMNDEISKIATALKISRKTKRIVMQNIVIAMVVKLAALSLGLFGVATVWEAVIADVGVAIIAIFNSMRVLNDKNI
ncbi:Cd2+/Zn2+-exporting ATPase [Bacilli bacterium PM5-3]|nr:Cd2+/Zn2+-exporting ATPase [Bacilli bacterium PM5-3]MDH6604150.1 Cd2+/Zn2+-exporting ATPase [Bacilli bacterium PM5-9]